VPNEETYNFYHNWAGGEAHTLWDREISMYVTTYFSMGLPMRGEGR
jgi:hypothetical protein